MAEVFISYRHVDATFASTLYGELLRRSSRRQVFFDRERIEHGDDFEQVLRAQISHCDVVLVLVGPQWLQEFAKREQAGTSGDDWVRTEIGIALKLNKRIIPVLFGGAGMPPRVAMPPGLEAFASRHFFELRDFVRDAQRLADLIDKRMRIAEPALVMGSLAAAATLVRSATNGELACIRGIANGTMISAGTGCALLPSVNVVTSNAAGALPASAAASALSAAAAAIPGAASAVHQVAVAAAAPAATPAFFPSAYYPALGTSLYYAALVLGAGLAARRRVGWEPEEIARIAACAGAGAGLGALLDWLVQPNLPAALRGYPSQLALWLLGLALGIGYGLHRFAPFSPLPARRMVALALPLAALAILGGSLDPVVQSFAGGRWDGFVDVYRLFVRTPSWLPIVLGMCGFYAWRVAPRGARAATFSRVALPLLSAMLAADLAAALVLRLGGVRSGPSMPIKFAWDNALFYGATMAALAWCVNGETQRRYR